jgi:hypothetical protein
MTLAKTYEELTGAIGRAMFFRPERRRVRDLLSREAAPTATIAGRSYALYDLSLSGLSFIDGERQPPFTSAEEVELSISVHGKQAFNGRGRVARVEAGSGGVRVAVALIGGIVDLPDLERLDEEARLERELADGANQAFARVPAEYAAVVARAQHFLAFYKKALDRHEARLRAQPGGGKAEIDALVPRVAGALREPWAAIDRAASRAALGFLGDVATMRAAKAFTETVITPLILPAPMVRRAYEKPLGYPGDYQVMLHYYDNAFAGDSMFARVFHKFFVEHPLSNGVRTRKDLVVDLMARELERVGPRPGRPFFVTSLGAGPAREVVDFVAQRHDWPGEIVWRLIDQEEETLGVAYHAGRRALARTTSQATISCLNLSFAQLLQEPALLQSLPAQDFIYCCGLFDYLREERARVLLQVLADRLAPGGLLAVGNALWPNEWMWSAEFVLDWTLIYRTRDEMARLAARLARVETEVIVEPGGAYYFLLLRKR